MPLCHGLQAATSCSHLSPSEQVPIALDISTSPCLLAQCHQIPQGLNIARMSSHNALVPADRQANPHSVLLQVGVYVSNWGALPLPCNPALDQTTPTACLHL